jgi:uncharacterized protein (TIGR02301 family)
MSAMRAHLASLLLFTSSAAAAPPEAKEAFDQRNRDLVTLAQHLGALHRYHQICSTRGPAELFRNRMREIVPLEAPMRSVRTEMIDAFNTGYRSTSALHMTCGGEARAAYEAEAQRAVTVTERLRRPLG